MAKKKTPKLSDESMVKADLANLIDAAKNSFTQFNEDEPEVESPSKDFAGASKADLFDNEEVEAVQSSLDFLAQPETVKSQVFESLTEDSELSDLFKSESIRKFVEQGDDEFNFNAADHESPDSHGSHDVSASAETSDANKANEGNEATEALESNENTEGDENTDVTEIMVSSESDDEHPFFAEEATTKEEGLEGLEEEGSFGTLQEGPTIDSLETSDLSAELEGTELEGFDSVAIEELEFVEETQLESIIESVLFATDRPVSLATLKQIFKGTNVTNARLKRAIEALQVEYAGGRRGVTLEEVGSGYQLRTKVDNMEFLRRSFKAKAFKLSGPALEVLAIVAYKQPVVKAEIDEIRGVESGHLLRALMEKNLVLFAGKSDLPGKPMQYGTTRKFLEIFGLRNLKELPTLSQIDELLPEGIGDEEQKPKLADITEGLSEQVGQSYSEGEEELTKITDQLDKIDTSSEFFEKEKLRQKQERDAEKARNLREAIAVGESVSNRDLNWLKRYDEQLAQGDSKAPESTPAELGEEISIAAEAAEIATALGAPNAGVDESDELAAALEAWDAEELTENERIEDNDLADIDEEIV